MNLTVIEKAIFIAVGIATAIILAIINKGKSHWLTAASVVCAFLPIIWIIVSR